MHAVSTLEAERRRLLAAVLDSPDDDLPRLVYADWLEEYAEESRAAQAELIRLQVALSAGSLPPGSVRYETGRLRERTILDALADPLCRRCSWHAPLRHGKGAWKFVRGFVERVSLTSADFLAGGFAGNLFLSQPVQRVDLTDRRPEADVSGRWRWWVIGPNASQGPLDHQDVPYALAKFMFPPDHWRDHERWWSTEEAAVDYFRRACLDYGRDEARKLRESLECHLLAGG
jgi:uncharacterized protein (TIGR02996 family)